MERIVTRGANPLSIAPLVCLFVLLVPGPMVAEDEREPTLQKLQRQLEELRSRDDENRRKIQELQDQIDALQRERREDRDVRPAAEEELSPLDRALRDEENERGSETTSALDRELQQAATETPGSTDIWSQRVGAANLRFVDLSVDMLFAVGTSTERDSSLETLQGGNHDPRKRGFTLQQVELSLIGAVDPFLDAEVHLIYFVNPSGGESEFELEEAFAITKQLPFGLDEHGLQLELGFFFTEFGRQNPRHPHAWDWLDTTLVNARFFGPDGLRNAGVRIGWLTPLPWSSEVHVGMQNGEGETAASFLANDEFFDERPIGGRPFVDRDVRSLEDFIYLARWVNSWNLTDEITTIVGVSGLVGPNATGPDGETVIYGADFLLRWRRLQNDRGWPFVTFQSEYIRRLYDADRFVDLTDPANPAVFPSDTLRDWGVYTQILYGFIRNWAAGIRYEFVSGSGASLGEFNGRDEDPFRDDRHRISPLVAFHPSEFSRIRLQYNYDEADHLEDNDAHSVWLGFEVLFGRHPAHEY